MGSAGSLLRHVGIPASSMLRQVLATAAASAALFFAQGCSTTHYVAKADREVYEIIEQAGPSVKNMDPEFTIATTPVSLEGLPTVTGDMVDAYLGDAGQDEVGAYILSLEKALEIAVQNSRSFQSTKESLYTSVLGYTLVRQQYRPVFDGGDISSRYNVRPIDVRSPSDAMAFSSFVDKFEALTGNNNSMLRDYADLVDAIAPLTGDDRQVVSIDKDRSISASTGFDVDLLLRGGTRIAAGITSNFLRFVTGDPRVSTSSTLFADISQPILGSNRRAARETILQAERNLLYDIRTFTRARQTFSIDIASTYYDLLQRKSTVQSRWEGLEAKRKEFLRSEAEVEQGKKTRTQLGLAEESVLSAENDWINAIQDYNDNLDSFKIRLGLPMDTKIVLDKTELDRLMERGLMNPPPFAIEDATRIAFANRLDYYTRVDQVDDVARRLEIAGEGLLPDVNLALGANVPSMQGDRFQELDFKRFAWDMALNVDPKLNRKRARNDYRRAVIGYDAAKRNLDDFEDRLELDLRSSFRSLDQLRFTYEIQKNRLELAKRRVFELELRQEMGAVQVRDQIEAQSDLTAASITLTRTVVNHTIANLNLWLDMGILYVKENGQWEEIPDENSE